MNIKNFIKRALAAVIAAGAALCTAGCRNDDGSGYIFKYTITANPGTLDPQIANDPNAEVIICNVYLGLLTANADGSLSAGAAEDYDVTDDGLVYTFRLRQDIYWYGSDSFERQCTAADFVNGFRRLFLPETKAPRAEEYYCIKNAKPINIGAVSDASVLGVKALGDFLLEITLEQPDPRFPQLLTEAPAMPCNEEFFLRSQGRYGLTAECTPSNGAFYVKSWTYSKYSITDTNNLILRRNAKNSTARQVFPSGLNFFIEDDDSAVSDFLAGTTSCIAVTDEQTKLINGDYPRQEFADITTGLIFNKNYSPFASKEFRMALALLAEREKIAQTLGSFTAAQAIVPAQVSMLDKSYRELADVSAPSYNADRAQALYKQALPSLDKDLFEGARIIVRDESAAQAVSWLMQEWQREFGFYCVVETLSDADYRARLLSGDFEAAVIDLSGGYNSPEAYLEAFSRKNTANYGGFADPQFEALLNSAQTALDLADSAELYAQAEQLLLDSAAFVPLYYKNEYFYTAKDCMDIIYNPFTKRVDFSQAKKF